MIYNHMLVIFNEMLDGDKIIKDTFALSKTLNVKVSLLVSYTNGINIGMAQINNGFYQKEKEKELSNKIKRLIDEAKIDVCEILITSKKIEYELKIMMNELNIDLMVLAHHSGFVSNILSPEINLINKFDVDLLVMGGDE